MMFVQAARNRKVERYLGQRQPELLGEFRAVVSARYAAIRNT
jgi:hypothetical protein